MANISDIAALAAAAIIAIVPDLEPEITFREAPGHLPLSDQEVLGGPSTTTRTFHVTPEDDCILHDNFRTAASNPYWSQALKFEIRYWVPLVDDGWKRLKRLKATDAPIIKQALYEADYGVDNVLRWQDLEPDPPVLVLLDQEIGLFLVTFKTRILYTRDSA